MAEPLCKCGVPLSAPSIKNWELGYSVDPPINAVPGRGDYGYDRGDWQHRNLVHFKNGIRCNQRQTIARAKEKRLMQVPHSQAWQTVLSKVAEIEPRFQFECCLNPTQKVSEDNPGPQYLLWVSPVVVDLIKTSQPVNEVGKVNLELVYKLLETYGRGDSDVALVIHMFNVDV